MIELKAELMKKKKEYEEAKKNPRKQPTREADVQKSESPVKISTTQVTEEELKKSREALEAKSRLYKKLERGKLMESDLNSSQRENLMVDFAWKGWNPEAEDFEFSESDEDSEIENDKIISDEKIIKIDQVLQMVKEPFDEDRWIEYEDEFGRTRVTKLSQFRQLQREHEEVNNFFRLNSHYDGDAEIRNKGVAFYQFARDEEERQRQMSELKKLREETVEKRMRILLIKEQRRLRIESRLAKLKDRQK